MTNRANQRRAAPFIWSGAASEPEFWLRTGAESIVNGVELQGLPIPPLWKWFDRNRPAYREPVARLFCHCGSGPVGDIARIWQDGREPVAEVRYQQRREHQDYSQMTTFRAIFHPSQDACGHGPLMLHDTSEDGVITHCRVHDLRIDGHVVAGSVGAVGGWSGSLDGDPPRPRRVKLR